ncbi:ATP-binding cassette domain-containing protein [Azohydromonas caseinilytica]|uniref:ATP-binding cassette domain-containing protein n=1 Tax=Azohydromonas caseinilytica TaxID=2728836 RepID=A0A848FEW6_9BURK|nr:ATP-binding cassette domain-containing protein [Azohydromonas caseinilytica]NML17626.1 ATP-binding cassette domain-containing protein [Azohydromonas caseinilytica]
MQLEAIPFGAVPRAAFVAQQPAGGHDARPASARGAEVIVQDLGKSYGGRPVLQDVTLRLAPGEFVAIVGRSGCGKSTLLRHVAGLEQPDAGTLRVAGDADGQGTRIMFQDARLLPWKSVLDNVALGLPQREGRQRARRALAQVGLVKRALEWPSVLSGGQRQRVALARALVHEPRLLLLDEPLGALDALTRIEMQQLIEALWHEHGFTALLVTHDVTEAVALADRVVLIEDHRIAFDEHVPLPRPRSRADPAFAAFEDRVLQRLLRPSPARALAEATAV